MEIIMLSTIGAVGRAPPPPLTSKKLWKSWCVQWWVYARYLNCFSAGGGAEGFRIAKTG
jgi:hypothetical protein